MENMPTSLELSGRVDLGVPPYRASSDELGRDSHITNQICH